MIASSMQKIGSHRVFAKSPEMSMSNPETEKTPQFKANEGSTESPNMVAKPKKREEKECQKTNTKVKKHRGK